MKEFEQHAVNLAQYSVLCTLPSLCVHLPSKKFLQTLYHRCVWLGVGIQLGLMVVRQSSVLPCILKSMSMELLYTCRIGLAEEGHLLWIYALLG